MHGLLADNISTSDTQPDIVSRYFDVILSANTVTLHIRSTDTVGQQALHFHMM